MISARLLAPVVAGLLAASTAVAAPASAYDQPPVTAKKFPSDYLAAPNFPESTMKLKVKRNPRPGTRVRVKISGFNRSGPISPGSSIVYDYDLYLYVANRRVIAQCPQGYDEMRNNFINNSDAIADLGSVYLGEGGAYSKTFTYLSGQAKKVIYCAYVRWIIDDVVVGALKHNFPKPRKG